MLLSAKIYTSSIIKPFHLKIKRSKIITKKKDQISRKTFCNGLCWTANSLANSSLRFQIFKHFEGLSIFSSYFEMSRWLQFNKHCIYSIAFQHIFSNPEEEGYCDHWRKILVDWSITSRKSQKSGFREC